MTRWLIATKVGFGFTDDGKLKVVDGKPVVDGRPEHIKAAVEGSLRQLRVERIALPVDGGYTARANPFDTNLKERHDHEHRHSRHRHHRR